jgi:hypothetical protein
MLKKCVALGYIAFFAIISTTIILPALGNEYTPNYYWPYYDVCSHCEHTAALGDSADTFCITGIQAWYDGNLPARYVSGNWSFWRGYGGHDQNNNPVHTYTTDSQLICSYAYGSYGYLHYEPSSSTPQAGDGPFHNCVAYYQYWIKYYSTFNPSRQPNVQGDAQSYFKDPNNPSNRWYVDAPISPDVMTAAVR